MWGINVHLRIRNNPLTFVSDLDLKSGSKNSSMPWFNSLRVSNSMLTNSVITTNAKMQSSKTKHNLRWKTQLCECFSEMWYHTEDDDLVRYSHPSDVIVLVIKVNRRHRIIAAGDVKVIRNMHVHADVGRILRVIVTWPKLIKLWRQLRHGNLQQITHICTHVHRVTWTNFTNTC